ncbi:Fc receptor-like protein 5 isoform 2-T2 [Leptodactylus fuscus]|uniref:Fc receptor-like protein 5 isoform X2 n=1 Tax=Leptodactylus fuscus TaxID=238119 RepID=UPI003F4E50C9
MYNLLPGCFHLWFYFLVELSLYEAVLQRPNIFFSASYATYLTGEAVSLECQITSDFTIHGYKFFKNNQEVAMQTHSTNKYKIRTAKRNDAGSYTCLYWISDTRGRQESEVSFPVSLSIIDQPSTPSLLVMPQQSLYFEGETVTLKCQHPAINSQITYHFYKDTSRLHTYQDTSKSELHISSLSAKDSGTYDCEYLVLGHQRTIPSGKSMQQTITVTALSSSPLLKFLPSYTTFINGENLTMECEAPSPVHVTLYRFYKEEEVLQQPLSSKGIYTLKNITKSDQAEYTCMYWSPKSNREIPSTQSLTQEIYVIDPLRPPLFFVDPPSGKIWDGGNVTLYCSAPQEYEKTTFHFLNDTDEIISVPTYKKQRTASVVINMRKSNYTAAIKYFCQYTAEIKGRSLLSPISSQVKIVVVANNKKEKEEKEEKEDSKPIRDGGCKVTSL